MSGRIGSGKAKSPKLMRLDFSFVGTTVFDLPAAELFLFLRDTQLVMSLVKQGRIKFSVVPSENGKKVLRAQGTEEMLQQLAETFDRRRQVSYELRGPEQAADALPIRN